MTLCQLRPRRSWAAWGILRKPQLPISGGLAEGGGFFDWDFADFEEGVSRRVRFAESCKRAPGNVLAQGGGGIVEIRNNFGTGFD